MSRCIVVLLLILLAGCQTQDRETGEPFARPPVEVSSQVDRAVATTGDEITYTVTINYDPAVNLNIPAAGAGIGGFRVVDLGEDGPRKVEDRLEIKKWYTLKADLVGSYILPAVMVDYGYHGQRGEASTDQIFVEVESVLNKEGPSTDIRDIKPLSPMARDIKRLVVFFSLAALAVIFIVAGAVVYLRKAKARERATPARLAHEIALEAIDHLRAKNLIASGQVRLHYFELSEIVRQYLENRFSFLALEQTTEEILEEMARHHYLDQKRRALAKEFLVNTDWVKFARHTPSMPEVERDQRDAITFIEETKEEVSVNGEL